MNQAQVITMIQADIPLHLWGPPGCGKTEWIGAFAKAAGMAHHVEILSQCDPTDFGIPREQNGRIVRMPLDWIINASEKATVISLDEFSLAPRSVLAATLTFVQSRHIADRQLHPNTRIVLASNGPEFTGVDLLPQQANRMSHVDFEAMVPLVQWAQGMLGGFPVPHVAPLPDTWQTLMPKHRALIASYVLRLPTEAFRTSKDATDLGRAWPSRRTWDLGARASAACEAAGLDDALPLGSLVGDGAALSYVGWRAKQDLPDPEDVLAHADTWVIPKDQDDRLFVILSACAAAAVAKPDPKKWGQAWIVVGRAAKAQKADIATVAARVLVRQPPPGSKTPKVAEELIPLLRAASGT